MSDSAMGNSPATGAVNINISTQDHSFSPPLRGISIGVAGILKVDTIQDLGVEIPAACLAVGIQHGICITKVWKVGTTATTMMGWR